MTDMSWLYEFTVILYALSVLGYFIDFLQNNRKVNRGAFWLLSIVWILQTIYFIGELVRLGEFPILTLSKGLFFYAWVIVTLSLIINRFFRVDVFVFFANVLGFVIMSVYLFAPTGQTDIVARHLMSGLLVIHVTIAFLARFPRGNKTMSPGSILSFKHSKRLSATNLSGTTSALIP